MKLLSFIEKHVGLVFCGALVLGIVAPVSWTGVSSLLTPLMGFLLFLSFLGVNLAQIKSELKQPARLALQVFLYFVVLPVVLYYTVRLLGLPAFALATLLLTAAPAGLGSPVFTSIAGGRTATSVVLSVITHVLVPFTIPLIFWAFTDVTVQVDTLAMAKQLGLLIGVPMLLSFGSQKYLPAVVAAINPWRRLLSIAVLAGIAYIAIVPYSGVIRSDVLSIVPTLAGTYLIFVVLSLTAFVFTRGKPTDERIAVILSRTYMNITLTIVLAVKFLDPAVALVLVLANVPWFTTFGAYLWFQKRFITRS